ncbi:MAG: type II toxin-antitoxin system prevent-host-death family antitoxin [Armatimonadetes bacterium]|nr:type II toxin-antitoxin system prevent-host-death family antitoxin [Armatimonadota bacterium]
MRIAGVREAKARLSQMLQDVRRGREWIITARGKPVARLVPVARGGLSLEERIRRLEDAGIIEPQPREVRDLPPPLPFPEGLAQLWLQEDRGE